MTSADGVPPSTRGDPSTREEPGRREGQGRRGRERHGEALEGRERGEVGLLDPRLLHVHACL